MTSSRNKKRLGHQRRPPQSQRSSPQTRAETRRAEPGRRETLSRRFVGWIAVANKAVLAAIGAGIIGAITASVVALPHLLANAVTGSPPPLTVAGGVSPNNSPPADPCSLQGIFVVPRTLDPPHTLSTDQLSALVQNAADAESTSGTYTLQAQPNQTLIITAIHTVVVKRVPAQRSTVVDIEPGCAGAAPPTYFVSVNLDATNLTPKVQIGDASEAGKTTLVHGLQAIVTNGSPILIDFEADTSRYDVIWKFRIDYTVNGQAKIAWIQNGSQPFHTVAARKDDTGLLFTLNTDETAWTSQSEPVNR